MLGYAQWPASHRIRVSAHLPGKRIQSVIGIVEIQGKLEWQAEPFEFVDEDQIELVECREA